MIRLQAHALNRYVRCNGAYHMPLPEAPSEYENTDDRREGIAAHWLAMQVIKGDVLEPAHMIDQQAPNGVYITSDMVEHIQPFVDDVRDRVVSDHAEPFVEEPCDFSLTPTIHIGCRIDTATYDADSGTLSIDEFKYGYRIVEPVDNWQLVAGVIGWMQKFDMPVSHVRLTIHQPRPQHANGKRRSLRLTIAEFEELEARLRWSLIGIETNSVATSGEWCYRCPALAHCTAARQAGYNAIDMSAQAFNDVLSDDDLATTKEVIDRALDRLKQLSDAYGELLVHRLDSGKVFQNWAKESSLGNRRWKAGITADNIRLVSGISIEKPGMMTPAQAEKAGVSKLITKAFTERPNTGFKLVKRSAADRAAAMFSPPETE